jgi:hypothetical protein
MQSLAESRMILVPFLLSPASPVTVRWRMRKGKAEEETTPVSFTPFLCRGAASFFGVDCI